MFQESSPSSYKIYPNPKDAVWGIGSLFNITIDLKINNLGLLELSKADWSNYNDAAANHNNQEATSSQHNRFQYTNSKVTWNNWVLKDFCK